MLKKLPSKQIKVAAKFDSGWRLWTALLFARLHWIFIGVFYSTETKLSVDGDGL